MCEKYPEHLIQRNDLSPAAKMERAPDSVAAAHPALITCCVLPAPRDPHAPARLLTCLLAALRASGS
ncbi:unnamed protein product [Leptidea sinapis]|uniref:Uncharacterized protein n=1 Tax=Leptidea sinapis TaxID=189913 RepID=A0A5E4QRT5_9NEOP|nr:unnamed protein product [Leptidea sinapis]